MNDIDLRQRAEDMPLGVSLRIMSAPASFALPMVQRKPFKPAFQVCLTRIAYTHGIMQSIRMLPPSDAYPCWRWCVPCRAAC